MSLTNALQTYFGFSSFREGQAEAIQSLLNQQHTLAIMPTGAGKSLIYQLAALQMDGVTLVISPLIALMKDQVDSLNRKGISATFINSAIPTAEQNIRLRNLKENKYRLVYVAPERLRSAPFLNALRSQKISLLAVDEAHCISEWGHDFRPDYLHIAEARRQLGSPLTVALTATATPKVQGDILRLLGLPASTKQIVTGFNRPNLTLEVKYAANTEAKFRALSELLRKSEFNSDKQGATLIYTGTRRDAEEVAEFIRVICKLNAEHYHAGLIAEDRARIQERFINGTTPVIVATNAFGMGIDRADVRQVIHYTLPGSLEAYYQEAGRAGRDGLPAKVILLYDPQDRALQEFFIQSSVVSPEELKSLYRALGNADDEIWMTGDDFSRRTDLHPVKIKVGLAELERVGALEHFGDDGLRMLLRKGEWDSHAVAEAAARSKEHTRHRADQLDHIINYAETNFCRRRIVLKYFGDNANPDAPVCCDNCLSQKETPPQAGGDVAQMSHAERAALVILDTVHKLGTRQIGRGKLAQILKGSKAQDILKFHYDKNTYYAKLAALKQNQIEEMIGELVALGYFKVIGGEYPVISLAPKGEAAVKNKSSIPLSMPPGLSTRVIEKKKAQLQAGGTIEYTEQLLNQGLTPEQIASQRGLTLITIYVHCAKLIEAEKLDVDKVVSKDIQEKIVKAIQKVGVEYLSHIKNILPEEITYQMIICVIAANQNPEEPKNSETSEVSTDKKSFIHNIVESGESRNSNFLPNLIATLKHENGNARRLAASALGKIGDARAVQPLLDLLATEIKPQIRQYAVKALGEIGDSRAIQLLAKILADENEAYYTRDSARIAIQKCNANKSFNKDKLTFDEPLTTPHASPASDSISEYLSASHPRPLKGNWNSGFALDFHSAFRGAEWTRSGVGDLTFRLKYQSDASVLPALIDCVRDLFNAYPEMNQFDVILPVPSSTPREFSPVHEFCKALSDAFGKSAQTSIAKTRQTQPQKEMKTLPQKRDNVAGAFALNGDITGKYVLLVDDLFDSGATLEEITKLLLKHKAARVNVLTLTRTIHTDA